MGQVRLAKRSTLPPSRPLALSDSDQTTEQREFDGLVDEVSIYNRALTEEEIPQIFEAGPAGKCSGPVLGVLDGSSALSRVTPRGTFQLFLKRGTVPATMQSPDVPLSIDLGLSVLVNDELA